MANESFEHYVRELVLKTIELDQLKREIDRIKLTLADHKELKAPVLFIVTWRPAGHEPEDWVLSVSPSSGDDDGWEISLTKAKRI